MSGRATIPTPTPWRCAGPRCHALLGEIVGGTLVMRQHARRARDKPRIIRVPSGTVEQDCYRCGLTNVLALDNKPIAC